MVTIVQNLNDFIPERSVKVRKLFYSLIDQQNFNRYESQYAIIKLIFISSINALLYFLEIPFCGAEDSRSSALYSLIFSISIGIEFNLGFVSFPILSSQEKVVLYRTFLEADPHNSLARSRWETHLQAVNVTPEAHQVRIALEAIKEDVNDIVAYSILAQNLLPSQTMTLPNGEIVSREQILMRILNISPSDSNATLMLQYSFLTEVAQEPSST